MTYLMLAKFLFQYHLKSIENSEFSSFRANQIVVLESRDKEMKQIVLAIVVAMMVAKLFLEVLDSFQIENWEQTLGISIDEHHIFQGYIRVKIGHLRLNSC